MNVKTTEKKQAVQADEKREKIGLYKGGAAHNFGTRA